MSEIPLHDHTGHDTPYRTEAAESEIVSALKAYECIIVSHQHFNIPYRVAYIVKHRQEEQPQELLNKYNLDGVFSINTMPVCKNGEIDIQPLKALIPPLPIFLEKIQQTLVENFQHQEIATLALPSQLPSDRLHIQSFIPKEVNNTESLQSNKSNPETTSSIQLNGISKSTNKTNGHDELAQVDIPLSKQQLAHPNTLQDSLYKAANTHSQEKLFFLKKNNEAEKHTLQQLLCNAQKICSGLQHQKIQKGSHAIILLNEVKDILHAFWGCILNGTIPVIIQANDTHLNNSDHDKVFSVWTLLDKPIVITEESIQVSLRTYCTQLKNQQHPYSTSQCISTLFAEESATKTIRSEPDDIAFISLSSGSTGIPKCIQLTHRNVLTRARGTDALCHNSAKDIILNWLPFDHIGSISDWHIRCIDLGCTMIYCNKDVVLANPLEWLNLMDSYRVSHTWAPNFAYAKVNEALEKKKSNYSWDFSCIKTFLSAAESVSSDTVNEFIKNLSPHGLAKTSLRPAFGMAELGSGITYAQPQENSSTIPTKTVYINRDSLTAPSKEIVPLDQVSPDKPNAVSFTSLGPLIPGMSMRIVDKQRNVLPPLCIGSLHVKGSSVSPGYYRNDEANKVFNEDGWMDTGDQGFIFENELYLSGRSKDTIIINGANYLPSEIEKVMEQVEGVEVSFCAATGVINNYDQKECLAVFFSVKKSYRSNLKKVLVRIRENIAKEIGITPHYIIPVNKEDIPKTAIGKIQRSKLTTQFQQEQFKRQIQEADLLLENERTFPNWFSEKSWLTYQKPKQVTSPYTTTIFLTSGERSVRLATQLTKHPRKNKHFIFEHKEIDKNRNFLEKKDEDSFFHFQLNLYQANAITSLFSYIDLTILHKADIVDLRPLEELHTTPTKAIQLNDFIHKRCTAIQALITSIKQCAKVENSRIVLLTKEESFFSRNINKQEMSYESILSPLYHSAFMAIRDLETLNINLSFSKSELELCDRINDELSFTSADTEVLLTEQARYVSRLRSLSFIDSKQSHNNLCIQPSSLVVITGGLGGVGTMVVRWLIERLSAKVLIIGRTHIDEEHAHHSKRKKLLDDLQHLGNVEYIACDIANKEVLEQRIGEYEKHHGESVSAYFHLAGVVNETPFEENTIGEIYDTFSPKVLGAMCIDHLASRYEESVVVNFSSTLSELTSPIAPTYAAANRFLDILSEQQRARGLRSYSISWSAWQGLGMSATGLNEAALNAQGLFGISQRHGLISLELLLNGPPRNVFVGIKSDTPSLSKRLADKVKFETETPSIKSRVNLIEPIHGIYNSQHTTTQAEAIHNGIHIEGQNIALTSIEEIPYDNNRNIDYQALRSNILSKQNTIVDAAPGVEKILLEIWQSIFKQDSFGVTDNFFALGGHSILASELISLINTTCRTELPVSIIFEAPTIKELAVIIDDGHHIDRAHAIPLQPKGNERPLFCLCGINLYSQLAQEFSPEIPVFAAYLPVENALLKQNSTTPLSVKEMASEYIQAIKTEQPKGPYRLLGISFGSALAYEVGQQLHAAGEEIELIALVDFVLKQKRQRRIDKALCHFFIQSGLSLRGFFKNIFGERSQPTTTLDIRQKAYHHAWLEYSPKMQPWKYSNNMMVFRARDEKKKKGYSRLNTCGWEQYTEIPPEAYSIPGDHLGVLQAPNVSTLANVIRERLLPKENS